MDYLHTIKVFCKREAEGDLTYRRERGNVTIGEGIGVMQLQAKECREPPKLEEAKNESFPRASKSVWSCQHLDVRLLASRTVSK